METSVQIDELDLMRYWRFAELQAGLEGVPNHVLYEQDQICLREQYIRALAFTHDIPIGLARETTFAWMQGKQFSLLDAGWVGIICLVEMANQSAVNYLGP